MADAINWTAPLHAPTEPGKYICRNGDVVGLEYKNNTWRKADGIGSWWNWTGAFLKGGPDEYDIIGKYVEPPPDEIWQNVYEGDVHGAFCESREGADAYALTTLTTPIGRTHIKRYVLAEIINLSDDTSGAKP